MRRIQTLADVTPNDRGASVAIGNFDGVHLGHQAVISAAKEASGGAPLGVLTFEPHPREVFQPDAPPFRLMNPEARAHRLEKLGVDLLFELPFESVRELSAEGFAADVLGLGLGVTEVTVGTDFRYGKGRAGTVETLAASGKTHGFGVNPVGLIAGGDEEVSSTAIRRALSNGAPEVAAAMLGHWHRIEGPVLHGDKRGRELGYPTANMDISGLHLPAFGVYAVLVDVLSGAHQGSYHGVASLGVRPMFGTNTPNLESYLFDFSGDLYGVRLSIGLVAYLRGEETFDGLDALIAQMDRDSAEARRILGAL